MNHSVEKLEGSMAKLTFEVTPEQFEAAIQLKTVSRSRASAKDMPLWLWSSAYTAKVFSMRML